MIELVSQEDKEWIRDEFLVRIYSKHNTFYPILSSLNLDAYSRLERCYFTCVETKVSKSLIIFDFLIAHHVIVHRQNRFFIYKNNPDDCRLIRISKQKFEDYLVINR